MMFNETTHHNGSTVPASEVKKTIACYIRELQDRVTKLEEVVLNKPKRRGELTDEIDYQHAVRIYKETLEEVKCPISKARKIRDLEIYSARRNGAKSKDVADNYCIGTSAVCSIERETERKLKFLLERGLPND